MIRKELNNSPLDVRKAAKRNKKDSDLLVAFDQEPLRKKVWSILEHENRSIISIIFTTTSLLLITTYTITDCYQSQATSWSNHPQQFLSNPWSNIEFSINIWFLLEFVVVFVCSPNKLHFLKDPFKWMSAVSVFPYFISLYKLPEVRRCCS